MSALVGGLIGFFVGGPPGALVGALVGSQMEKKAAASSNDGSPSATPGGPSTLPADPKSQDTSSQDIDALAAGGVWIQRGRNPYNMNAHWAFPGDQDYPDNPTRGPTMSAYEGTPLEGLGG